MTRNTNTFTFTEKEMSIMITALGLISEIASSRPRIGIGKMHPVFDRFARDLRQYLREKDFSAADFKDLAVKLGVRESVVYDGLSDLK